jgi:hypothetical protein
MCVESKKLTLVLVLAAALLLPSVASAQNARASTGDWSALNSVASGSKLAVKLKTGKSVEGRLSAVSDTALSLSVKNKPVDLRRDDVQSVYEIRGAAIGAAADSSSDGFEELDHAITAGLTVLGAGAGALTGYLIGRHAGKRVLVYEAGRP